MIHPTAVIEQGATIASGVSIGAYAVIGSKVSIESGSRIFAHVCIAGDTTIGRNNHIHPFTILGASPASVPEQQGRLRIGDDNIIRECCVLQGGHNQPTEIGSKNYIMAYSYFACHCRVGNSVIVANRSSFDNSVELGDYANIGAGTTVLPQTRIGSYSMIGGGSQIEKDVPAYTLVSGDTAKARKINNSAVDQRRLNPSSLPNLRKAFELFYIKQKSISSAIVEIRRQCGDGEEIEQFIESLRGQRSPIRYRAF